MCLGTQFIIEEDDLMFNKSGNPDWWRAGEYCCSDPRHLGPKFVGKILKRSDKNAELDDGTSD